MFFGHNDGSVAAALIDLWPPNKEGSHVSLSVLNEEPINNKKRNLPQTFSTIYCIMWSKRKIKLG